MDGLIEGLLGCQTAETKSIVIKFPIKTAGPGAAMSGQLTYRHSPYILSVHMSVCLSRKGSGVRSERVGREDEVAARLERRVGRQDSRGHDLGGARPRGTPCHLIHSHTYIHTYIPMGEQVLKAVEGEGGTTENLRNDKLATALLDISDIDQVRHTPLHLHPPHDAGRPNLTYGRGRYRPV